ncbi:MAG: RNA polymerase sigma factor [Candidatus Limnocylindrales bacterium]
MLHVMSRQLHHAEELPRRSEPRERVRDRVLPLGDRDLDRAYRLAGLLLGSQSDAEDATQEALLRAWRDQGSLRDPQHMAAWFDRILVNVCRDQLRARRKVRFVAPEASLVVPQATDAFREILDRDQVLRAMQSLDADCKVVVVLHYWGDLTLEAVAQHTGWRLGTVKSRLHRALGVLRAGIGDRNGWDGEP